MRIEIPPITSIFGPLADWRKEKGKRYELVNLLLVTVFALLCREKELRAMARWGRST